MIHELLFQKLYLLSLTYLEHRQQIVCCKGLAHTLGLTLEKGLFFDILDISLYREVNKGEFERTSIGIRWGCQEILLLSGNLSLHVYFKLILTIKLIIFNTIIINFT
jgi:hypothetical protein